MKTQASVGSRRDAFERLSSPKCQAWNCSVFFTRGGAGLSWAPGPEEMLLFGLTELQIAGGPALDRHFQTSLGPVLGIAWRFFEWWRFLGEFRFRKALLGDDLDLRSWKIGTAWNLKPDIQLRLQYADRNGVQETFLSFNWSQ